MRSSISNRDMALPPRSSPKYPPKSPTATFQTLNMRKRKFVNRHSPQSDNVLCEVFLYDFDFILLTGK